MNQSSQQQNDPNFRMVQHPSGRMVCVPIEKVMPSAQLYVHDAKTTCRYASKRCTNPRTTKRNGELHSFCEWHRAKANQNQRRLESKKKLQRDGGCGGGGSDSGASSPTTTSSPIELSHTGSAIEDESMSPRWDYSSSSFSKLGSPHISHAYPHEYDDESDGRTSAAAQYLPDPFEPIGAGDHHAWAASHQHYYHQQQQQQQQTMEFHSTQNGYAEYTRPAYPQGFEPQDSAVLMEWELAGDLVGSSVAYAQTLNL